MNYYQLLYYQLLKLYYHHQVLSSSQLYQANVHGFLTVVNEDAIYYHISIGRTTIRKLSGEAAPQLSSIKAFLPKLLQ